MTKKILSIVLIFSMLVICAACDGKVESGDRISIVCTTFAAYDWVREIIGENADEFELTLLGDGVDLHSFQPTTQDIAKIHTADLFVQIGGTTEKWTKDLKLGNKALRLFELLDDTEKLCIAGNHINLKFSEDNYDEHIWLSLKMAQRMVSEITTRICELDNANGVQYQLNCAEYIERLKELDEDYKTAADKAEERVVIFADRYPFAYLMNDYDITCFSAFDGCSSDTNASFDTITHLTEEVKAFNKDTVLVLENSAESVAQPLKTALGETTIEVAVMNSCQTINVEQDTSYIDIMTQNLESLKAALGG